MQLNPGIELLVARGKEFVNTLWKAVDKARFPL